MASIPWGPNESPTNMNTRHDDDQHIIDASGQHKEQQQQGEEEEEQKGKEKEQEQQEQERQQTEQNRSARERGTFTSSSSRGIVKHAHDDDDGDGDDGKCSGGGGDDTSSRHAQSAGPQGSSDSSALERQLDGGHMTPLEEHRGLSSFEKEKGTTYKEKIKFIQAKGFRRSPNKKINKNKKNKNKNLIDLALNDRNALEDSNEYDKCIFTNELEKKKDVKYAMSSIEEGSQERQHGSGYKREKEEIEDDEKGEVSCRKKAEIDSLGQANNIENHVVFVSENALNNLSDQIALSLNKMRHIEEQMSIIPELQRRLDDMVIAQSSATNSISGNSTFSRLDDLDSLTSSSLNGSCRKQIYDSGRRYSGQCFNQHLNTNETQPPTNDVTSNLIMNHHPSLQRLNNSQNSNYIAQTRFNTSSCASERNHHLPINSTPVRQLRSNSLSLRAQSSCSHSFSPRSSNANNIDSMTWNQSRSSLANINSARPLDRIPNQQARNDSSTSATKLDYQDLLNDLISLSCSLNYLPTGSNNKNKQCNNNNDINNDENDDDNESSLTPGGSSPMMDQNAHSMIDFNKEDNQSFSSLLQDQLRTNECIEAQQQQQQHQQQREQERQIMRQRQQLNSFHVVDEQQRRTSHNERSVVGLHVVNNNNQLANRANDLQQTLSGGRVIHEQGSNEFKYNNLITVNDSHSSGDKNKRANTSLGQRTKSNLVGVHNNNNNNNISNSPTRLIGQQRANDSISPPANNRQHQQHTNLNANRYSPNQSNINCSNISINSNNHIRNYSYRNSAYNQTYQQFQNNNISNNNNNSNSTSNNIMSNNNNNNSTRTSGYVSTSSLSRHHASCSVGTHSLQTSPIKTRMDCGCLSIRDHLRYNSMSRESRLNFARSQASLLTAHNHHNSNHSNHNANNHSNSNHNHNTNSNNNNQQPSISPTNRRQTTNKVDSSTMTDISMNDLMTRSELDELVSVAIAKQQQQHQQEQQLFRSQQTNPHNPKSTYSSSCLTRTNDLQTNGIASTNCDGSSNGKHGTYRKTSPMSSDSPIANSSADSYEDARVDDCEVRGDDDDIEMAVETSTSSLDNMIEDNNGISTNEKQSSSDQKSQSSDDEDSSNDEAAAEPYSLGSSYKDPSDFEEYHSYGQSLERRTKDFISQSSKIPNDLRLTLVRLNEKLLKQHEISSNETSANNSVIINHDDTNSQMMDIVRREWFIVAAKKDSKVAKTKLYVDYFESFSKQLLNLIVNLADNAGNTAMHYAASYFRLDIIKILLDTKVCDVNCRNKAGYTPTMLLGLVDISKREDQEIAKTLFNRGNVNIKSRSNGQTALMLAARHGQLNTCKLLLSCGADPSIQDHDGSTALMCGSEIGHQEVVRCLLANRLTDPSITDNDGLDALTIAMNNGHKEVAMLLYAAKDAQNHDVTNMDCSKENVGLRNFVDSNRISSRLGVSSRRSRPKVFNNVARRGDSLLATRSQNKN